jgi:predicted transcriptional regulator
VERLVQDGEVVCQKEGGFSRFYPLMVHEDERSVYSILRKKTSRAIVGALILEPRTTNKRIAELSGLAKSTVSEEIKRLIAAALVRRSYAGRIVYELEDRSAMMSAMARTEPASLSRAVESFVDLWDF